MVYSSLASYFQGGIIFLVSIISYIWVLLGTSHLPNLGYPGSCFLQWPVWNLACGVSILLAPPSWALLPSPPLTFSQCLWHSTYLCMDYPSYFLFWLLISSYSFLQNTHLFWRGAMQCCRSSQSLVQARPAPCHWASISAFDDFE